MPDLTPERETYLRQKIQALEDAITSGASFVSFPDGSSVRYQSIKSMRFVLAELKAELLGPSSNSRIISITSQVAREVL